MAFLGLPSQLPGFRIVLFSKNFMLLSPLLFSLVLACICSFKIHVLISKQENELRRVELRKVLNRTLKKKKMKLPKSKVLKENKM